MKDYLPADILTTNVVGVTETASCAMIIEHSKIDGLNKHTLQEKLNNIGRACDKGLLWIIELDANNLSHALLDEDFFFDYCDKTTNPLELSKRITLFNHPSSYWTEEVYIQAFE